MWCQYNPSITDRQIIGQTNNRQRDLYVAPRKRMSCMWGDNDPFHILCSVCNSYIIWFFQEHTKMYDIFMTFQCHIKGLRFYFIPFKSHFNKSLIQFQITELVDKQSRDKTVDSTYTYPQKWIYAVENNMINYYDHSDKLKLKQTSFYSVYFIGKAILKLSIIENAILKLSLCMWMVLLLYFTQKCFYFLLIDQCNNFLIWNIWILTI